MDVGADLDAKPAIMCRKTVLIPENDEESAQSGFRQHFHFRLFRWNYFNSDIFSGTNEGESVAENPIVSIPSQQLELSYGTLWRI